MSTGTTTNSQGIYSPLPLFSDTESSEEEVFNKNALTTEENHVVNRKVNMAPDLPKSTKNGKPMANSDGSMLAEYRPLSNSETSLNGFGERGRLVLLPSSPTMPEETKLDAVTPIRENKQHGWKSMSLLRKACFVWSIFLCFFTIFGFLWLLPCDLESSCPRRDYIPIDHASLASTGSWEAMLKGIEVTGVPSLAQGHLILTVRGPQPLLRSITLGEPQWMNLGYGPFKPDTTSGQAGGGIIALWPNSGGIAWAQVTPGPAPRAVLCDLLDATGDGRHDCLISNSDWLLAALDPAVGTILWYLHIHRDNSTTQNRNSSRRTTPPTQRKPARIRFPPLKIRDVDGDGVPDLCALCSPQLSSSLDSFVLISGRRGNIIGRLVNVSGCVFLTGLELEEADNTLAFTCGNQAGAESVRIMAVEELFLRAVNRSLQDPSLLPPLQKRQQPPRENIEPGWNDGKSYFLQVRGHNLYVTNEGVCPRCSCRVLLTDNHNITLWSYRSKIERAMAPVALQFTGSVVHKGIAAGTTNSLSGFVLKFWQWPPQTNSRRVRKSLNMGELPQWNTDRAGNEDGLPGGAPEVWVTQLKERVLLITFNDTDLHVINASQSDVAQLCATPLLSQRLHVKEPLCQPELPSQQNSLLIADLDDDGTQELVSFTSTYDPVSEISPDVSIIWELISKIKVIHLETELPKLA